MSFQKPIQQLLDEQFAMASDAIAAAIEANTVAMDASSDVQASIAKLERLLAVLVDPDAR